MKFMIEHIKLITVNIMKSKSNKENLRTEESTTDSIKLKCDHLESLIFNVKLFTEKNNISEFKKYLISNY